MTTIEQRGSSPFAPAGYKDYGARGDGTTDDTAAINAAVSDGGRCGEDCGSSTIYSAFVYFPSGTYPVSSPIIQYYNTEFYGNPFDYPTILAASSFVGLGVITSDVYVGEKEEWYVNINNFLRSIRNFKLDVTRTDPNAYVCAIHWQIAQGTSLENIIFYMMVSIWRMAVGGSSQLTFLDCKTALQIHWDWAWTLQDLVISICTDGVVIVGGAGGSGSTGQVVGSLIVLDTVIASTKTGIATSLAFIAVDTAIVDRGKSQTFMSGGSRVNVESWGFGRVSTTSADSRSYRGANVPGMSRSSTLTTNDGYVVRKFFQRRRPAYTDISVGQIDDVKAQGAAGDGRSDDTAILNSILARAADRSSVLFFPFGVHLIRDTLHVPVGSRIIGQDWSQIMATGSRFQDESNPHVASTQGSAGLWDSHFRVGGATGSEFQLNQCPKGTGRSSAYLENVWLWTADHDLDTKSQDQIDVYAARGMLIESWGPTWMYATASEHHVLYQYQMSGARDLFMTMIQTESPYFQPVPKAPTPFTTGLWFSNYVKDCLKTENCQQRGVEVARSTDTWIYNLVTKGTVEMVCPVGETPIYAANNVNAFTSSFLAWIRAGSSAVGNGIIVGMYNSTGNRTSSGLYTK
ncbi:pectin lyase-like protein [Aspergillus ellipticus CBS 707.79]|uniref:Pectin lyase-like protein n=1 Tax=Aspergillus ellipticus CBS 707.79 TaxID=1448320 RepID=A0A319DAW6_9EURO|nr:pectin lyase-like protein [Aspergillus ellipticus CBS 707.79]